MGAMAAWTTTSPRPSIILEKKLLEEIMEGWGRGGYGARGWGGAGGEGTAVHWMNAQTHLPRGLCILMQHSRMAVATTAGFFREPYIWGEIALNVIERRNPALEVQK